VYVPTPVKDVVVEEAVVAEGPGVEGAVFVEGMGFVERLGFVEGPVVVEETGFVEGTGGFVVDDPKNESGSGDGTKDGDVAGDGTKDVDAIADSDGADGATASHFCWVWTGQLYSEDNTNNKATFIGPYTTQRASILSRRPCRRVAGSVVVRVQRWGSCDGFWCFRQRTA
jgi:hypothetical protein